jgi:hypothetical protein
MLLHQDVQIAVLPERKIVVSLVREHRTFVGNGWDLVLIEQSEKFN